MNPNPNPNPNIGINPGLLGCVTALSDHQSIGINIQKCVPNPGTLVQPFFARFFCNGTLQFFTRVLKRLIILADDAHPHILQHFCSHPRVNNFFYPPNRSTCHTENSVLGVLVHFVLLLSPTLCKQSFHQSFRQSTMRSMKADDFIHN
jgi:hypothetical protein